MSNITTNTSPAIRAQVYSMMMQQILIDELLSLNIAMDASEFGDGTTFNIPSIGECVIRDVAEDTPVSYDAIDTGNFTMTIANFKSAASYVSRKLKEDGYQATYVESQIPIIHVRKLMQEYETKLFATANSAQTAANANTVNSQSHRFVGSGTSNAIALSDFAKVKTSLDKANVPGGGRIMLVDPLATKEINLMTNLVNVINNPRMEGIINTGISRDRKYLVNLYGIDIYESNRLPDIASETIGGATITSGKAAIAMCVIDPDTMPLVMAWRRKPTTEAAYNKDFDRDEYVTYSRYGTGCKRKEALAIIIHNVTNV